MTVQINGDTGVSLVQDNTIQTADIVNGAVTADKLASGSTGTAAPQKMMLMSAKATTSGTAIDFSPVDGTGIPNWAKKVSVLFNGNSLSGTTNLLVQLGTSSGVETTGYTGNSITTAAAQSITTAGGATTGFVIRMATASAVLYGDMELKLVSGNTWLSRHEVIVDSTTADTHGGGVKTLTGTLDRIRITTVNGTDTFDAGSISLLIEG